MIISYFLTGASALLFRRVNSIYTCAYLTTICSFFNHLDVEAFRMPSRKASVTEPVTEPVTGVSSSCCNKSYQEGLQRQETEGLWGAVIFSSILLVKGKGFERAHKSGDSTNGYRSGATARVWLLRAWVPL